MGFDRARFDARLATRRLGRVLLVRAETRSTNDDAWDALAEGLGDGVVVVADAQTAGRGRSGRAWAHAPGLGLALSIGLYLDCDPRQAGIVPLGAGLALAEALAKLGAPVSLKWPNDVLLGDAKLAGALCEMRRVAAGGDAVVIGVGVNVLQRREDFSPEVAPLATSLAIAGIAAAPEDVAAEFLLALERWWPELEEGDRARVLAAWSAHAAFWGEAVAVRTPTGSLTGIAQRLDPDGGLVLRLESGTETVVIAGDVEIAAARGNA